MAGLIGLGLPAERRLIPLWFLLHVQHTGQFLFIWVSTILDGGSCLVPLWRDVWVSATFAILNRTSRSMADPMGSRCTAA